MLHLLQRLDVTAHRIMAYTRHQTMNRINDCNEVCHLCPIKSLKNLQQIFLSMNGSVPLRLGMHIQQQNLHERLRFSSDQFSPLATAIPR